MLHSQSNVMRRSPREILFRNNSKRWTKCLAASYSKHMIRANYFAHFVFYPHDVFSSDKPSIREYNYNVSYCIKKIREFTNNVLATCNDMNKNY